MRACDTLIAPRWCVPVEPAGTVLDRHAVIVNDGTIRDILPASEAFDRYRPGVAIERPDHVLIPGLVNTHTHAAMTLLRGFSDDLPLESWLSEGIWPAERRWVSAEMVRDGTELAIAEMITGGTTCFSDQYFFPEIVAETAVDLHMRAMVGTPVIDFPTAWARTSAEYLSRGTDLVHDRYADHPLISTCFAPHATYSLSDESFAELRMLADQLDVRVQIHLHESSAEIDDALRQTGLRPFDRLERLGLVNASLLAVHYVHPVDSEVALLAERSVSISHCPKSNLKLASGIAPVTEYMSAGVNVAIGTDGAASNNVLDMLSELRFAALLARARSEDAAALTANDALRMATLNGARALGLERDIGSIEAGKQADLACIDLSPLNSQPVYDPVSQLVYTARATQVTDVWIAGRHQLDNGKLTQIDTGAVRRRCSEWHQRIAQTQ